MRHSDSCLLLLFGSKLLAELNWHNNTSARPTLAMPAVLLQTIMRGWRTHLHGYFLSLVIVAALHESKGKHSIQISEGMKSRLRQEGKTEEELLLLHLVWPEKSGKAAAPVSVSWWNKWPHILVRRGTLRLRLQCFFLSFPSPPTAEEENNHWLASTCHPQRRGFRSLLSLRCIVLRCQQ